MKTLFSLTLAFSLSACQLVDDASNATNASVSKPPKPVTVISSTASPTLTATNTVSMTPTINPTLAISPSLSPTVITDESDISTSDIEVPENFDFVEHYTLQIHIDNSNERQGYLSICDDFYLIFVDNKPVYDVNYANCILRQKITQSETTELVIANDKTELVAVIWTFDKRNQFLPWSIESGPKFNIVVQ